MAHDIIMDTFRGPLVGFFGRWLSLSNEISQHCAHPAPLGKQTEMNALKTAKKETRRGKIAR